MTAGLRSVLHRSSRPRRGRAGADPAAPLSAGRGRTADGGRPPWVAGGRDLAARCAEGRLDAAGQARSRAERKHALTAESSSRWAGAITRTSEDAYRLAGQNLRAEQSSLSARISRIQARLAVQVGRKAGRPTVTRPPRSGTPRRSACRGCKHGSAGCSGSWTAAPCPWSAAGKRCCANGITWLPPVSPRSDGGGSGTRPDCS